MFAVTLWEMFTLGQEQPWSNLSCLEVSGEESRPSRIESISLKILRALEERHARLPCPEQCPPSIYTLLLSCWSLEPVDRPKFHQLTSRLTRLRPIQYRVTRDSQHIHQMTLIRGDTVSVFQSDLDKAMWKGQNHRTHQVGFFPSVCLSGKISNEKISWPLRGSFMHTGHSDGSGQGPSWGHVDSIDE